MQKGLITLCFIVWSLYSHAQLTITINKVPSWGPSLKDELFVAGSFNGWNPGDPNFKLQKNTDGSYSTVIKNVNGKQEFKITRGDWDKAETDSNGGNLANREIEVNGATSLNIQVIAWSDMFEKARKHTASPNVHLLDSVFFIPQLKTHRRVWIYLPANYSTSLKKKRYPVLYMQDGQNLFDEFYAPYGEWHIDETLDSLKLDLIVVAIDHGETERLNEYSPYQNRKYGGGRGNAYLDFIVNTLRPYINQNYRTLTKKEATGIMGSSMGGLISFYGGLKYDNVFGKVGVFSPSFWFQSIIYDRAKLWKVKKDSRFYILAGEKESDDLVEDVNKMKDILVKKGVDNNHLKVVYVPDGKHAEWFWSREFPEAIQWLFNDH